MKEPRFTQGPVLEKARKGYPELGATNQRLRIYLFKSGDHPRTKRQTPSTGNRGDSDEMKHRWIKEDLEVTIRDVYLKSYHW